MTPRSFSAVALSIALLLSGCSALTESLDNPEPETDNTSSAQEQEIAPQSEAMDQPTDTPFSSGCEAVEFDGGDLLSPTRRFGQSLTIEAFSLNVREWSLPAPGQQRWNGVDEICPGVIIAALNGGSTLLVDVDSGAYIEGPVLERSGTIESVGSRGIDSGGPSYGIRDLVVTPTSTYYSVGVVDEEASCLRMEVRRIDTATLLGSTGAVTSGTIYESSPCVDFADERRFPAPLKIHLGGALAVDTLTDTVYVTIGDYHMGASRISQAEAAGIESTERDYELLLDPSAEVSALVAIASASSNPLATVSNKGLRNPLGLVFDLSGQLWLSEMGPGGGDEINLIVAGADYGWPLTSPGAPYDRASWPEDPNDLPAPFLDFSNREIPGTTPPVRSWTPAIAPAALDVLPSTLISWGDAAGSLVLGTLRDESLHLLDSASGTLDTVVRIPVERRLRDTTVTSAGDIVSVTDEATLTLVTPG